MQIYNAKWELFFVCPFSFTGEIDDLPTFKRYAQNSLLSPKVSAVLWVFFSFIFFIEI